MTQAGPGDERLPAQVLLPLPDEGFDVTEVAVPWKVMIDAGYRVVFATEHADRVPQADDRLLADNVFRPILGARPDARELYAQLIASSAFQQPISWKQLETDVFAGLYLAGGHAPGMRQYLGSDVLQSLIAGFFDERRRPIGAICHGTLLLARAILPATGKSVIHDATVTALPKSMERLAYVMTAALWGRHYRTDPAYVQDEVEAALKSPTQFRPGPMNLGRRGTAQDDRGTFIVESEALGCPVVTARWPGDAYRHARAFVALLDAQTRAAG